MPDQGAAQSTSPEHERPTIAAEPLRGLRRVLLEVLRLLPKNAMSRLMGRFASLALPGPLQRVEIRLFARLTGIDLSEARDDVEDFASLQEFFTRALLADARPIEGGPEVVVAPCDGTWGESGRIEGGMLLQVKGRPYELAALLADAEAAAALEGGCYATFYLSPRDYHRFHAPTTGRFVRVDYRPGALWPVNSIGLNGIDGLFAVNERICAYLLPDRQLPDRQLPGDQEGAESKGRGEGEDGRGAVVLVAVGATMVGSVKLGFDEMTTNDPRALPVKRVLGQRAHSVDRGEEWGYFEFGSTIVMLTAPGVIELDSRPAGTPLRLGEAIGRRL